jgi:hypothetical protein
MAQLGYDGFAASSIALAPARNDDDDNLPKAKAGREGGEIGGIGAAPTLQEQHLPPPTPLLNP